MSSVVPPAAIFPSTPSRPHPSLLLWSLPVSGSRWSQLLMHTRILVASRFTAKFSYSFFGQFIVCVCKTIMFPTVCNLLLVQPPHPPTSAWLTAGYSFGSLTTEGRNVVWPQIARVRDRFGPCGNELGATRAILENGKPKSSVKCGSILSWPDK